MRNLLLFIAKAIGGTLIGRGILEACHWFGWYPEKWLVAMLGMNTDAWLWLLAAIIGLGLFKIDWLLLRATPNRFPCDLPTLERLCQLVTQLREDATDYYPHQPDMLDRWRELKSHSAVFAAAGLTNELQWFLNYVGDSINQKKTYLRPADRADITKRIDEAYPILKAALDADYGKRRTSRQ
jgi:hypothetical protein